MEQIIVVALAIVALWWGVRGTPWKTVKARVRCRPGRHRCVASGNVSD